MAQGCQASAQMFLQSSALGMLHMHGCGDRMPSAAVMRCASTFYTWKALVM